MEAVIPTLKRASQDRYLALVYYNLGTAVLPLDAYKAAADFNDALTLSKENGEFSQGLAEALFATGDLKRAEMYAKSAEAKSGQ